ncbi:nitrile hydratase subunit beta [Methylohalobius crimeensis]|uniref:nitrile hydratase subunit beta n=1 Tax=Methylohalobius crimeensis TaxID=244365 RepID=UPI0003B650F9|nr:nitrile hydratase subunit beta [Methylohalobius crimeensis]
MKLQHNLGGLEGLGSLQFDKHVFFEPWEKRIFGIHVAMMALSNHLPVAEVPTQFDSMWTWGHLRKGAEAMNPFEYFKFRYYEKWLGGISSFLVGEGYISHEELDQKTSEYLQALDAPLPADGDPAIDDQVIRYLRIGDSPKCDVEVRPKYKVGDWVVIKDFPPSDHTRLPGYLRNKVGVIDEVYEGAYSYFFPTADGIGAPMPIYGVKFEQAELWGELGEPGTVLYADLFETYIQSTV